MRKDVFSTYHPAVTFIYFVVVMGCSMFVMHPIFLGLSLLGSFFYNIYLNNDRALKTGLKFYIPVFLLCAFINPLFNHKGVTILGYMPSGNPLTLESLIYGLATGVMLVTVLNWFSCYQKVMTSDKFIYLFGKVIPAMSLVLSMAFRFVPKFQTQLKKVSDSQKIMEAGPKESLKKEGIIKRSKKGMNILSILITWSLENSVITADSMRSRGYGLRGRNNFTIFRFDTRDKIMTVILGSVSIVVLSGIFLKKVNFLYYPMLTKSELTPDTLIIYISYGILCLMPWIINKTEDIKWHYLRSKI